MINNIYHKEIIIKNCKCGANRKINHNGRGKIIRVVGFPYFTLKPTCKLCRNWISKKPNKKEIEKFLNKNPKFMDNKIV